MHRIVFKMTSFAAETVTNGCGYYIQIVAPPYTCTGAVIEQDSRIVYLHVAPGVHVNVLEQKFCLKMQFPEHSDNAARMFSVDKHGHGRGARKST